MLATIVEQQYAAVWKTPEQEIRQISFGSRFSPAGACWGLLILGGLRSLDVVDPFSGGRGKMA